MNNREFEETTSTPCAAEEERLGDGDDDGVAAATEELVECELEAAEALAGLAAHSVSTAHVNNESVVRDSVPGSSGRSEQEKAIAIPSEHEPELKRSFQCPQNYPPVGSSKLRQNLTEVEKEERRLCRVLANRESARQTIRRRQALYEELARKAAELTTENEDLKKKKELAAEEYNSLKNKNASLREQMAILEKAKQDETEPTNTTSTSLYNQPTITPFFWPSSFQPSDGFLLQCGSQNITERPIVMNRPENPLFVLPYPYLIPFHTPSSPFLPWASNVNENVKHNEPPEVHQCSSSSLRTMAMTSASTSSLVPPGSSGRIESSRQDDAHDVQAVSPMAAGHVADASEQMNQESVTCTSKHVAAAKARRKRKEVLKLKAQHFHQCRMHD